MLQVFDPFTID